MLSNQALKNGISFESVCDKLDINIPARKSEFLKEIRSNLGLLQEFNITFNEETKIFKYEQIETIRFHAPVSVKKIVEYVTPNIPIIISLIMDINSSLLKKVFIYLLISIILDKESIFFSNFIFF